MSKCARSSGFLNTCRVVVSAPPGQGVREVGSLGRVQEFIWRIAASEMQRCRRCADGARAGRNGSGPSSVAGVQGGASQRFNEEGSRNDGAPGMGCGVGRLAGAVRRSAVVGVLHQELEKPDGCESDREGDAEFGGSVGEAAGGYSQDDQQYSADIHLSIHEVAFRVSRGRHCVQREGRSWRVLGMGPDRHEEPDVAVPGASSRE